ncbi:tetratricopeptide repeat protein [Aquimarina sp. SS2-1]|uniref:tetratricopeptide repeat protein n=1 Tax=Aquimarina besae TaxID=3342247 RepID=UPI003671B1BA
MNNLFKYILIVLFLIINNTCKKRNNIPQNKNPTNDVFEFHIKNANDRKQSITERKKHLKKASNIYSKLEADLNKLKKTEALSNLYYNLKDFEASFKMDKKILELSKLLNDSLGIAKAYSNYGIHYRNINKLDSAYHYFYSANKIYESYDKNKSIDHSIYAFNHGKILIDLAKLSRNVKNFGNSEALTIEAIKKFKFSGNERFLPICYNNLGMIAKNSKRYNEAINYYKKVIELTDNKDQDTLYKTVSFNNIGTVYKSKEQYDKAEKYFKKGLSFESFLRNKPKRFARLLDNLGYVKFLANKNNDSSLYLFNKAYKIRDSIKDIRGLSTNYLHLAKYYQSKDDNYLSKEFAEKAKQAATTINENTELLQAYDLLAQVSPPEEGRQYAMQYIKLSDSLTKRDNLFRDKFARIRFETEEKEKQILQKEQLIKEGEQQIQEVQNQNTIYLLGMLLLVTFIAFIIYFSRQRTRYLAQQNKIVEFQAAYETETRISKRLHDELGNDIFQVMMQYQNDPHDPQITKKLNTAYTKARDISRENSEFEVDETYVEELTDMLTNYTENHCKLVLRGIDKIDWDTVDKNLKITIYRVLQELMTNMQKHSQADLVAIVFKNDKNKILIKYSDNGVGIEQEDIRSKNGLRNTEKRIQAVSGTIAFDSANNKGFKAEIIIPL